MTTYSDLWNKLKPYAIPDMRAIGTAGGKNTSTGGVATMAAHELASTSALGAYHTLGSGVASGNVLVATSASAAHFAALTHSQLTGVGANDHHTEVHAIVGAGKHTYSGGAALDVFGLSAASTIAKLTPSSSPGTAGAILRSADTTGLLTLQDLNVTTAVTTPTLDSAATLTITPGTYAILSDGKSVRTTTYTSGFAGAGFTLNQGVTIASQTYMELDNLTVRGVLAVYELLVRQIRATNGSIFVSSTMKIASYSIVTGTGTETEGTIGCYYRLYPDTEVSDNVFLVGDVIRAQRFTGTGTYRSDLTVTYVDGGNAYCIAVAVTAQGPEVGFEYVRLGSTSNAARRGGLYMSGDDTGAPFLDVWDGVDAHSDWNTAGVVKMRLGKLDGITAGTNEYGLWAAGANAGDHLLISPTSGFELVSGNGLISINDDTGMALTAFSGTDGNDLQSYHFTRSGTIIGGVYAFYTGTTDLVQLKASAASGRDAQAYVKGVSDSDAYVYLQALNTSEVTASITLHSTTTSGTIDIAGPEGVSMGGDVTITGNATLADTYYLAADKVRARDSGGLRLEDDSGTLGIFVEDGGLVGINNTNPAVALDVTGAVAISSTADIGSTLTLSNATNATLNVGNASLTTGAAAIQLGNARTGAGNAYIDFISDDVTYTDYGLRIIRAGASSPDGTSTIDHRGTGIFYVGTNDAAALKLRTNNSVRVTVQDTGETLAEAGLYVNGDLGGIAGYTGFTDIVNTTQGSGVMTIQLTSTSNRQNTGFLKVYIGTTAAYIPYTTDIT